MNMSLQKYESQDKGHTYVQWAVAILANSTFLTFGLQNGWVSPVTKRLQSDQSPTGAPLTDIDISLMASIPCLVATFGVTVYAFISDRFGRKTSIIAILVPQALCWIIKLCPSTTTTLVIARGFCGMAAGGTFGMVPMYVKEISQDDIRGVVGLLMMLSQNVGVLAMYAMGAYLDYYTVLWIVAVVPVLSLLLMIKAPESPSFLVKVGKVDEAASTIATLRGLQVTDKKVQNELDLIKKEDELFKSIPNISFLGIFKQKPWRRGILIMMLVISAHAVNGGSAVVSYASTILQSSGVNINPDLQVISIPVFMIIATFVSMIIVEKLGRKTILSFCFFTCGVAYACLASTLMLQQQGGAEYGWLSVVAIIVAVSCYSAGVSPIPYVIMSEMFNFQIRAKILGCIVTWAWFLTFVQVVFFGAVMSSFGLHVAFYIFGAINLLGAVLVLVLLPETKGKTIEEIEMDLKGK